MKKIKLLGLLVPVIGVGGAVSLTSTSCSDPLPTCPNVINIDGKMSGTVFTAFNPYNDDWDIKGDFKKTDILNESKYSNNRIKWDIAYQWSYYLGNNYDPCIMKFISFERKDDKVKFNITLEPKNNPTKVVAEYMTSTTAPLKPDAPEFVAINLSGTNQGTNTAKMYGISAWTNALYFMGDFYEYGMSRFLDNYNFGS